MASTHVLAIGGRRDGGIGAGSAVHGATYESPTRRGAPSGPEMLPIGQRSCRKPVAPCTGSGAHGA